MLPGCATALAGRAAPDDRPVSTETLGLKLTDAQRSDGVEFLRNHASVDVHAHPGLFFLRDARAPTPAMTAFGQPFEARAIADLASGRVSAALFAGVSDMRLLELSRTGIAAVREFAPGEAYEDYRRQIANLRALVAGGSVMAGTEPTDILRAHRSGRTACIFSVEGGDFIEDRLERVAEAHSAGVRAITIVHYNINQIGDIQTAAPRHNGLTTLGKSIVREMNARRIIVDLAHAPYSVTRDAVDASIHPMMISHTNLSRADVQHPRLVSVAHARLVTEKGGIVGSVPWGIGQKTLADWIDNILRLVDAVGIDHVGIGTDMDANFAPVFTDYKLWHLVPAALLARGMGKANVARIMGGNFRRILLKVAS